MTMNRLLAAAIMLTLASMLDAASLPPQQKQWLDPWRPGGEQVPLWPSGLAITRPELKGPETAGSNVARPTIVDISVLLPTPLRPRIASVSPCGKESEISERTWVSPQPAQT